MRIRVLGSGAGGGFPQWNCNCRYCRRLRQGDVNVLARTQSSIAVSGNGVDWVVCNASPDIRAQLTAFPTMQPCRAVRDTAVCAIVLTDAQIDHTSGLLLLREHTAPLDVYCTDMVYEDLTTGYPLFRILDHFCGVDWHPIPLTAGESFAVRGTDHLRFTAVPLMSKAPPYSPRRDSPHPGDNIGLTIQDTRTGKKLFYAPGLGEMAPHLLRLMAEAECVLVDGTVWTDAELGVDGISDKLASEMGHLQLAGEEGLINVLKTLKRPRKVVIHINNTNPILDEASVERAELEHAGIEASFDGMEMTL